MSYEYKYIKYKKKYLNLKKGGVIEGSGSYGVIYSSPRLPYKEKYSFKKQLVQEEPFSSENIQTKEVSKIFERETLETSNKYININYFNEKDGYINILNHIKIPKEFFNIPSHYGIVDTELIISKPDIYNKTWASTLKNQHSNIYIDAKYQITFPHGISIKNNNFNNSINKFKNIINAVKFMNNNNLVFDDLKTGNLLEVDSLFKISDFSSLMPFSNINYKIYKKLNLYVLYYYIFSSLLNLLLYYYLHIREDKKINTDKIINKINKEYDEEESIIYKKYIDSLCTRVKIMHPDSILEIEYQHKNKYKHSNEIQASQKLNDLHLPQLIQKKNKTPPTSPKNRKKTINITVAYMFDDILLFYKDQFTRDSLYKLYLKEMIKYLDKKFGDNIDEKINNLLRRINLYSLGISLLEMLHSFSIDPISRSNINIDKYKSLLEIIGLLTINIFKDGDHIYITEPNIDHVIQKYEEL
jgi:hypothetical protein